MTSNRDAWRALAVIGLLPLIMLALQRLFSSDPYASPLITVDVLLAAGLLIFFLLPDILGQGRRPVVPDGPHWVRRRLHAVLGTGAFVMVAWLLGDNTARFEQVSEWAPVLAILIAMLSWTLLIGWCRLGQRPAIRARLAKRLLLWACWPLVGGILLARLHGTGIPEALWYAWILAGAWANLMPPHALPRTATTRFARHLLLFGEILSTILFSLIVLLLVSPRVFQDPNATLVLASLFVVWQIIAPLAGWPRRKLLH